MAMTPAKYMEVAPESATVSPDGANVTPPDGKRVPAERALEKLIENDDAKQSVTLIMAGGWDHVLPKTDEEDPGNLIMWNHANLTATVQAFNDAIAAGFAPNVLQPNAPPPHPPAWLTNFPGVPELSVEGLQNAILRFADYTGGEKIVGNALIAPNSVEEYGLVFGQLLAVGFDPFFRAHVVPPLGRHYILKDRKNNTTATPSPVQAPPHNLGVRVFE